MKSLGILFLVVALAFTSVGVGAQTPEVSYEGDTETITLDLTVSGMSILAKTSDESCLIGGYGLLATPTIDVTAPGGDLVSSTRPGVGAWSLPGEWAHCNVQVEIEIPDVGDFQLTIAPYFVEVFTSEDVVDHVLTVAIHREYGDQFPISPYPKGGPIEGTDEVLIVGTFELRGTPYEEFMPTPLVGCIGMGGYDDIRAGMQITIKDEYGKIVGLAEMLPDDAYGGPDNCLFYFTAEVPISEFYTFESGRRGGLSYSHEDLELNDWIVSLTLGR